jgi:hypothetical protein
MKIISAVYLFFIIQLISGDRWRCVAGEDPNHPAAAKAIADPLLRSVADTTKKNVSSLAALRNIIPKKNEVYHLSEPGKEGDWVLDDSSKLGDNSGTVVVTKKGRRLKRVINTDAIELSWFETTGLTAGALSASGKTVSGKSNALIKAIKYIHASGTGKKLKVDEDMNADLTGVPVLKKGITGKGRISFKGATIYQEGLDVIGLPQNIRERLFDGSNPDLFGEVLPAPLAARPQKKNIDVLAHFYNDTGLSSNALNPSAYHGWYDSRMFFTNADQISKNFEPYDPSRHPMLGWYKGDDPNVLDWQCYWLVKYGVTAVIPTGSLTSGNFNSNPKSSMYWVWNMMNKVKNFKLLKYILYLEMDKGKSVKQANAQQDFIINTIVSVKKNVYCYHAKGKIYPVFFVWDMESARGLYDNYKGSKNVRARLTALAKKMKTLGYDGICILGRNLSVNPATYSAGSMDQLESAGCLVFNAGYFKVYDKRKYAGYADYASSSSFPSSKKEVVNVFTAAQSRKPHPSKMNIRNSTPRAFATVVRRAARWINANGNPKMLTVYNVGEWAEGGPGLQPNQRDGFGYLQAIKDMPAN